MTGSDHRTGQYATTARLEQRRSVWGPGPSGVDPAAVVVAAVVDGSPGRVLEIGCGTGALARRVLEALPACGYLATDESAAMVATARAAGVPARVVEASDLPFDDGSFDVVVAAWMLYHVPALDRTLAEVARVLGPGGALVAATNGERHLETLFRDAGRTPVATQFTSENGEAALRRHFGSVSRTDVETRATFADRAAAQAYLSTLGGEDGPALPPFDGPRTDAGFTTVFVAR